MKKIQQYYPSIKLIIMLSFAISILMHAVVFLSLWFGDSIIFQHDADFRRPPFHFGGVVISTCYTFILAFVLYLYNMYVQNRKGISRGWKITLIIVGSILIAVIISYCISLINPLFFDGPEMDRPIQHKVRAFRDGLMRNFFIVAVVVFSWQLLIVNHNRRKIAIENETLTAENLRTRFEVLKNQMNPHFLFNSLNTLQSLIGLDDDKAREYVQELSKVLRYTLQNQETTSLEEELNFTTSYCHLMQIRYGENLKFIFDIDESLKSHEIIPLSLEVLIENAIKHNVISDKQPLTINILTDTSNSMVAVSNKIQSKIAAEAGNGIGLANLSERYRLKWNRDIEINKTETDFEVRIALIGNESQGSEAPQGSEASPLHKKETRNEQPQGSEASPLH